MKIHNIEDAIAQFVRYGKIQEAILLQQDHARDTKRFVGCIPAEQEAEKILTQDERMRSLKARAIRLSVEQYPVLIHGETGTGKELFARVLHGWRQGMFVAVNCTAIPETLIESELFGHKKGSFTGAEKDRIGKMVYAKNGTLFLDEIGDMPVSVQAKLLRALQFKKIHRVGDEEEIDIGDVRIVSATHKDVWDTNIFREDLMHRLSTFELKLPNLQVRGDDYKYILQQLCPDFPIDKVKCPTEGNVRALEKLIANWKVFGEVGTESA